MTFNTKTAFIIAAAATAQTLPEAAVQVQSCASFGALGTAADTLTNVPVVTGTPGTTDVQFAGTPAASSKTLTLGTAAVAGQGLLVTYVPVGAAQSAA